MKNTSQLVLIISLLLLVMPAAAQTSEFVYQGQLQNASVPASGNYDFEFRLFDSLAAGAQVGPLLTRTSVAVVNGTFAVKLDFGSVFPGADRFLEIGVRTTGAGIYSLLSPRQKINSAPYAVKSISADTAATSNNALQLGSVPADQFVQTADARLSDARNPLPGSADYIQNSTNLQTLSNFNVSGTGTASIFNASTGFNIAGNRVLTATGGGSVFVGRNTGILGTSNAFLGDAAGASTVNGGNSFVGWRAGFANTTGNANSFFGTNVGSSNIGGINNTFLGGGAGGSNTSGSDNLFAGIVTGFNNISGNRNVFIGGQAGGLAAGNNNTALGYQTSINASDISFATSIGSRAMVFTSDTISIGKTAGTYDGVPRPADTVLINGPVELVSSLRAVGSVNTNAQYNLGDQRILGNAGTRNLYVGIAAGAANLGLDSTFVGYRSGDVNTSGNANTFLGTDAGGANTTGSFNTFVGSDAGDNSVTGSNNTVIGAGADVGGDFSFATAIGAGAIAGASNTISLGRSDGSDTTLVRGILDLQTLVGGGATHLCRTASNQVGDCSSSLRYKTNLSTFSGGTNLVKRLKPITFDWKDGGMHDLGLGAEDVAAIEPLLVTYNKDGRIEGVKYDRIGVVLINAIKEQNARIEAQENEIAILKMFICSQSRKGPFCSKQKPRSARNTKK
jgi:hypothetical protein